MADESLLQVLHRGVNEWNEWRQNHPEITNPDLFAMRLPGRGLIDADLTGANLSDANLSSTDLTGADLTGAILTGANLTGADLSDATLTSTILSGTDLAGAIIIGVKLTDADLSRADLSGTILFGADLSGATLFRTNLTGAILSQTRFSASVAGDTAFSDLDLRGAEGLETVEHVGPSVISTSTIYQSEGKIPEVFLRGCGVPESLIVQIPALVAAMQPIQFYSCFISYSSKDEEFAQRLYADLQSKGVRCWFAPEDLKIGDRFRRRIDEVIRVHDKLLLILSENSVASSWVEKEVETAMESEDEQKKTILFPVRLDDSVMKISAGWPADVRRTRNIGDFRRWKEHDEYQKAFARLLADLKASA